MDGGLSIKNHVYKLPDQTLTINTNVAHMFMHSYNVFTWVSVSGSLAIISAKICSTPVATSSTDDRPGTNKYRHTSV